MFATCLLEWSGKKLYTLPIEGEVPKFVADIVADVLDNNTKRNHFL
jgi:hypothetical protein